MSETCKTCGFWDVLPGNIIGECRRYAPRHLDEGSGDRRWPETADDDFCGEHKPKEGV